MSRWIPTSGHQVISNSQCAEVQVPTIAVRTEVTAKNSVVISDDNNHPNTHGFLLSTGNVSGQESKNSSESSMANVVLSADEPLTCNGKRVDKSEKCASVQFSESDLNSGSDSMVENSLAGSNSAIEISETYNTLSSGSSPGKVDLTNAANPESGSLKVPSDGSRNVQKFGGVSNDFVDDSLSFRGEPSTFLLDEELDLEHTTTDKDHLSLNTR